MRTALAEDHAERPLLARATPAWPFVSLGIAIGAMTLRGPSSPLATGAIAGSSLLVLAAHGAWKRLVRRFGRAAYLTHLTVAPVAIASVVHHVGASVPANAAGALVVATVAALVSGAAGLLGVHVAMPAVPRAARGARRAA